MHPFDFRGKMKETEMKPQGLSLKKNFVAVVIYAFF